MNTQKLLFSILSSLLIFLILEGLAQLAMKDWPSPTNMDFSNSTAMPFHPERLWSLEPSKEYTLDDIQYKITKEGFRQSPLQNVQSTQTLLAIGDSSTYGFGVDAIETYLSHVGNCLNVKTLNGGIPGYSSAQSLIQLEQLLKEQTVNKVIIANLWSDMMPAQDSDAKRLSRVHEWKTFQSRSQSALYRHSAVYRWLTGTVKPLSPEEVPIDSILMAKERGTQRRVSAEEYVSNLSEMVQLAKANNVDAIILLLPTNFEMEHPPNHVQGPYRDGAKGIAERHGLVLVDMDSIQSTHSNAERFLDFVHPNSLGHQEIGKHLCAKLK